MNPGYPGGMRTLIASLLLISALEITAQMVRPTARQRGGAPGSDLDILNTAVATFDGTLRALNKKHIVLELSEEQTLSIEVTKKTLYFRGSKTVASRDVSMGAVVTVEAKKIANQLVALNVRIKEAGAETAK